ncbi:hypothetical protein N7471_010590 [Penicillium samsonianum]|uniref:uncharacterized protein n=1 Tax=Penicillium samsonianum TaxID=1882272 RepID=UPI002548A824|nr:uncharacterized protein N7471_010590 [Penicillium samsonianum]KAJ6126097.1 hypothetical protein N7471_010590 [Penicillium samsonianum]
MLGPVEKQGGSPGYDTIIRFTREPPPIIQNGDSFTVSVMVMFGESRGLPRAPTQAFAINVSLVDEYGAKTSGGLQGSLTSNMQFHPHQPANGFAVFDNLAVCQTGSWRLRILLGAFSCAEMTVEARADSNVFHASDLCCNSFEVLNFGGLSQEASAVFRGELIHADSAGCLCN